MADARDRRRALGLGVLATLLYLATAPAVPNLDGLGYIKLLPHNFAAGHLLYMPILRAMTRVVGDGLRAGRLIDALAGGSGVVLFYGIARRLCGSERARISGGIVLSEGQARFAATFAAAGLALSYGYWSEANDVEAYALATAALLVVVRLTLSHAARPTRWRALGVGLGLGVAVLCHLTHVLLSCYVAVALWQKARGRRERWLQPALALGAGGVIALAAYAYAAFSVRHHDLHAAIAWVATAQHGFVSTGGLYKLGDAIYGLAKAVVFSPYLYEADAQKLIGQFLLGLVPLGVLAALVAQRPRVLAPLDRPLLAAWVVPYALLGVAFFGSDPERWLFVLPVAWLAAALAVCALERPLAAALLALVWVGGFNLATGVWPAHNDQWPRQKAEATAALVGDGDLVLFPGHSWDEYVVLYGHARFTPFPISYYAARDGVDACFQRLDRELQAARARGGRVFVMRAFDDADEDPRGFWELGTRGVSRAALRARLRERGQPVTLAPLDGFTVVRLDP